MRPKTVAVPWSSERRSQPLPLPIAPDGAAVLVPNGGIYETANLTREASLGGSIHDAAWTSGGLVTLAAAGYSGSELRAWDAGYQLRRTVSLPGTPVRIFSTRESALVITLHEGRPHFGLFNRDLHALPLGEVEFPLVHGAFFAALTPDVSGAGPGEGVVTLSLSASGVATGVVLIDGARLNFRAQFDSRGRADLPLALDGEPVVLSLQLALDTHGKWIFSGALDGANWSMELTGTRAEREAPPGRYAFDLRGSGGDDAAPPIAGSGSLTVSAHGRARVAGSLATGRGFSGAAWVQGDGTLALHGRTNAGGNTLAGTIQYADLPASDWTGYLQWSKPAADRTIHPGRRLTTFLTLTGAAYDGQPGALGVGAGASVDVALSREAVTEFSTAVFLEAKGRGAWGADLDTVRLRIAASGLVSGSFRASPSQSWSALRGAVNQKTRSASGYFRSGARFGEVHVTPRSYSGGGFGSGSVIIFSR